MSSGWIVKLLCARFRAHRAKISCIEACVVCYSDVLCLVGAMLRLKNLPEEIWKETVRSTEGKIVKEKDLLAKWGAHTVSWRNETTWQDQETSSGLITL